MITTGLIRWIDSISPVLQVLDKCEDMKVKTFLASAVTSVAYVGEGRPFCTQPEGHCVHASVKEDAHWKINYRLSWLITLA